MKTLEYHYPKYPWIDKILNSFPFCLHKEHIYPLICGGVCKQDGKWKSWFATLRNNSKSLFYNGAFFIRIMAPFWIGIHIRWSGKNTGKREYLQCGLGWKLNGRFSILFRIQTDKTAAEGEHGPNHGQATGFECGTK